MKKINLDIPEVAVREIRHTLCNVARNDDDKNHKKYDAADFVRKFTDAAALFGDKRTVLRLGNDVLRTQDERRHEQQPGMHGLLSCCGLRQPAGGPG